MMMEVVGDLNVLRFSKKFNVPYITKVEMLTEYLRDQTMKTIKLELLFDFITDMNVTEIIKERSKENES